MPTIGRELMLLACSVLAGCSGSIEGDDRVPAAPATHPASGGGRSPPDRARVWIDDEEGTSADAPPADRPRPGPPSSDDAPRTPRQWLQDHQAPDGCCSVAHPGEECIAENCFGTDPEGYAVRTTAWTALAFVEAGIPPNSEDTKWSVSVTRAVRYLLGRQEANGCFGDSTRSGSSLGQAATLRALAAALGHPRSEELRGPLERGVAFALASRNAKGVWGDRAGDESIDANSTALTTVALREARSRGIVVDDTVFAGIVAAIDPLDAPFAELERVPTIEEAKVAASCLLVRLAAGGDRAADPAMRRDAEIVTNWLPRWDDTVDGSIDFRYWYCGTLAIREVGGESWRKWSEAVYASVIHHQEMSRSNGHVFGAWPAEGPGGKEGGRAYTSALGRLIAVEYYTYPKRVMSEPDEHVGPGAGSRSPR